MYKNFRVGGGIVLGLSALVLGLVGCSTTIFRNGDNNIKKAEEAEKDYRRGPFTFSSIGVNPGEEIVFVSDPSITATVVDDKHIQLGDTVTSLSGAAKSILHKNALQGPKYWTYKGKVLDDIRTEKENGGCK